MLPRLREYLTSSDFKSHLLLALCVLFFIFLHRKVHTDDAYIFYTYARNIASGNGYVFNIGEHVNATTSPLYTLLLAAAAAILSHEHLPIIGHAIGAICLFMAMVFLHRIAAQSSSLRPFSVLVPLCVLLQPALSWGVGMESFLVLMCMLGALRAYVTGGLNRCAAWCALMALARPDTLLFTCVLGGDFILRQRKAPPPGAVIIFGAVLLPWAIFSWSYFGALLPNTVGAKLLHPGIHEKSYPFISKLVGRLGLEWWQLVIAAAALLSVRLLKTEALLRIGIIWGVLYVAAYGMVLRAPAYSWYYTPLALTLGLVLFMALTGIISLTRIFHEARFARREIWPESGHPRPLSSSPPFYWGPREPQQNGCSKFLAALGICKSLHGLAGPKISFHEIFGPAMRDTAAIIRIAAAMLLAVISARFLIRGSDSDSIQKYERYTRLSSWLSSHAAPGSLVAANEIGILGYYWNNGKIVDGLGLLNPKVVEALKNGDTSYYVRELKPDYAVFRVPPRARIETFQSEEWFVQSYIEAAKLKGGTKIFKRRG